MSIGQNDGATTWTLSATGRNSSDTLVDWSPTDGLHVHVVSVSIGNTDPGAACPSYHDGDVTISMLGDVALDTGAAGVATVIASACVDLATSDIHAHVYIPHNSVWPIGPVSLASADLTLDVNARTGVAQFSGSAQGWVTLDGKRIDIAAHLEIASDGAVLLTAHADLSAVTGATAKGYLFYTSIPRAGFDSGDPAFGRIDLPAGVSIAVRLAMPADIAQVIRERFGVDVGDAELQARASVSDDGTFQLDVALQLPGNGVELFRSTNDPLTATTLTVTSLHVGLTDGTTIEIGAAGRLHFPAMPDSQPSDLLVEADVHINLSDGSFSVGVSTSGSVWHDAFGVPGLNLSELGAEVGLGAGGIPTLGLTATVVGLPERWATDIGYQQGAPIRLALNLSVTAPLIDIEIGTPGGTTPVLSLGHTGPDDGLTITYAHLYIAPVAVTIGGIHRDARSVAGAARQHRRQPHLDRRLLRPEDARAEGRRRRSVVVARPRQPRHSNLRVHLHAGSGGFEFALHGIATFGSVVVTADIAVVPGQPISISVQVLGGGDAIPGLDAALGATGTASSDGTLSGSGDTEVGIGDLAKHATVEMTDDGLVIHFAKDQWTAVATVSMSGLDATLVKDETAPIVTSPELRSGAGIVYRIHAIVDGSGLTATANARGLYWEEKAADGFVRHETVGISFTVHLGDSKACFPIPFGQYCFDFSDPLSN